MSTISIQITGEREEVLALFDRPSTEEVMANFTALAAALADVSAALDPLAGQVQQVIAIVQELRNQPPPTEDPAIQAAIDSMVTTVASMTTTINAMVTGLQTVTST